MYVHAQQHRLCCECCRQDVPWSIELNQVHRIVRLGGEAARSEGHHMCISIIQTASATSLHTATQYGCCLYYIIYYIISYIIPYVISYQCCLQHHKHVQLNSVSPSRKESIGLASRLQNSAELSNVDTVAQKIETSSGKVHIWTCACMANEMQVGRGQFSDAAFHAKRSRAGHQADETSAQTADHSFWLSVHDSDSRCSVNATAVPQIVDHVMQEALPCC